VFESRLYSKAGPCDTDNQTQETISYGGGNTEREGHPLQSKSLETCPSNSSALQNIGMDKDRYRVRSLQRSLQRSLAPKIAMEFARSKDRYRVLSLQTSLQSSLATKIAKEFDRSKDRYRVCSLQRSLQSLLAIKMAREFARSKAGQGRRGRGGPAPFTLCARSRMPNCRLGRAPNEYNSCIDTTALMTTELADKSQLKQKGKPSWNQTILKVNANTGIRIPSRKEVGGFTSL
jgi:hypothetical protein